jgi:hypothetical protein
MEIIKPRMTLAQLKDDNETVHDMVMASLHAYAGVLLSPEQDGGTREATEAHLRDLFDSGRVYPLYGDVGHLWAMLRWDDATQRYCFVEIRVGTPLLLHVHSGGINLVNHR